MKQRILVIGSQDIGKTTLINALLGWDILPQATDWDSFPTEEFTEVPWGENAILVDSPGYDAGRGLYDARLPDAIGKADAVLVMPGMGSREERQKEAAFLKRLLSGLPEKKLYFVIAYDADDWPGNRAPLFSARAQALWHFLPLSRRPDRFFCVDAMAGLVAAIEDDVKHLRTSGIAGLRAALRKEPL